MARVFRRSVSIVLVLFIAAMFTGAAPARAHDFANVVYVDLTAPERGHVRAELLLDSYLLVVSATDYTEDLELGRAGNDAQSNQDAAAQAAALDAHADSVLAYVIGHFAITAQGRPCQPVRDGPITAERRDDQPYVALVLDYDCPDADADAHEVRSDLFPDSENYTTDTKTIVTFDLDLNDGTAILDSEHRSFSTHQSWPEWFWSWFRVGAEHLLYGLDHILFLVALIIGSRRPREIVLTATTFTVAHSVTFILAALGVVEVPGGLVEPVIALSIAVVAGWHLWRSWRRGPGAALDSELTGGGHFGLDRPGWSRLGVVFCFGLVHGLGFAGALGIDEPLSWRLMSSLLVFNLGIEAVQLGVIAAIFPALLLLRRYAPRTAFWASALVSTGVAAIALVWFVERAFGG
ncbi:HupE/UreJ family protein [Sporichthya sp.]|uniref:HupE/UreJ family protein n=1 Tax=Sporichthya sp. TaxID=65475 RepID=UPI001851A8E2|nr:HupE/UreJ family protein [Sporichthya sp.]MBA3745187.1 HupE/UreJ family protein [Sporichthya sp.]